MTIQKMDGGIYVDTSKISKIKTVDSVIFDCDGVLIDVSNSYDLAIKKTVEFVLQTMANIRTSNFVTSQMIEGFKASGGFNDEVDTTYSLILCIVAGTKLEKNLVEFVFNVIGHADQTGIRSMEKYLDSLNVNLSEIKKKLNYPGKNDTNPLTAIFDEIFYGADLFSQLYDRAPKFFNQKGLIENDKLIVSKQLIKELQKLFGKKLSIVSGRSLLSTKYSLKSLFDEFDISHSRFLEDEPREFAKPNPSSLISSLHGLGSSCCMFVGDSVEDFLMAKQAEEQGKKTIFCAIFGTSKDPQTKRELFEQKHADIILESINLIPKALNLVKA